MSQKITQILIENQPCCGVNVYCEIDHVKGHLFFFFRKCCHCCQVEKPVVLIYTHRPYAEAGLSPPLKLHHAPIRREKKGH